MVWETGSDRVGAKHHRGTAMDYYAGIDVSLEQSSVCVVDATGKIVCEAKGGERAGGAGPLFGDRPGTLRVAPGGLRERLTFQH